MWNQGKQGVFINNEIQADIYNALAYMDLSLYYGTQADRPMTMTAAHCFCSERSSYPPLARELPKYWVAVAPQHFYGGEVVISPLSFRKLKTPGKYRIQGKYTSLGFLAENINNPLHYCTMLRN